MSKVSDYCGRVVQDVDGSPSSKRIVFVGFAALFPALLAVIYLHAPSAAVLKVFEGALNMTANIIMALGGTIVAERVQNLIKGKAAGGGGNAEVADRD